MTPQIRDYQEELVAAAFRDWNAGAASTLAVMPTGSGKTVAFAEIARQWDYARDGKVVVTAHRARLLEQAYAKLHAATGRPVGVEAGPLRLSRADVDALDLFVVSKDSLHDGRLPKFAPEKVGLLIIDEAHRGAQKNATYNRLYEWFGRNPRHRRLGVTATCGRSDKVALVGDGAAFRTLCYQYPLWREGERSALSDGWLVPPRQLFVTCDGIDLSRADVRAGADWTEAQIEQAFTAEKPLHQTALGIVEHAGDRPTFVFCSTTFHCSGGEKDGAHSPGLVGVLNRYRSGSALAVHGKLPDEENDRAMLAFRRGEVQFLVSCDKLIEGVDETTVSCVAICRPTKFWGRYAQMVGRALRPLDETAPLLNLAPDAAARRALIADSLKPDALVLDFVGLHGLTLAVSLADILAEAEEDTPLLRLAKRKAQAAGGPADVARALGEARAELWRQATKELLAERAALLARGTFRAQEVDPFGGGTRHRFAGPKPVREPASERQVRCLCWLGVAEATARGWSKGKAGAVISRLKAEQGRAG
jgi:superfamily II DNA or RNA helicase